MRLFLLVLAFGSLMSPFLAQGQNLAPFGVTMNAPGSCNQIRQRFAYPPSEAPGLPDPSGSMQAFKVPFPTNYFPDAREIGFGCVGEVFSDLHITVVRDLPSDTRLKKALAALSSKYERKVELDNGTALIPMLSGTIWVIATQRDWFSLTYSPSTINSSSSDEELRRRAL